MSAILDLWRGMTGTVLPFGGTTAPSGWLLCYGQAISRTTYARLFAALGTTWGVGDGTTTFNLPDMRDRMLVGKGDMGGTPAGLMKVAGTGNTTSASAVVSAIPGATIQRVSAGMKVVGTGIPAGVTVSVVNQAGQVTLSSAATATGTAVALQFFDVDTAVVGSIANLRAGYRANATDPGVYLPAAALNYIVKI